MDKKFILIIFGATGDLSKRKLIPALFDIYKQSLMPKDFKIVGIGRKEISSTEFREESKQSLYNNTENDNVNKFCEHLHFFSMDTSSQQDYDNLKINLQNLSQEISCNANYIFYFAIPPFMYATVAEMLYNSKLTCNNEGWKRLIVEKPFGNSYNSAIELNKKLTAFFSEDQIYRIDHYLGKETVQNILVTRFSNSVFEPLWNRNYIEYVEITSSETLGVGSRSGYYDKAGALRDMVQNHLLQLLGIVSMEPPINDSASAIRNEMVKVFNSLKPINIDDVANNVIRAQYTSSSKDGKEIKGYLNESGINPQSKTETFVALKCYIDNWRWSGVPFYIRTGKNMPARVTEVAIHFRKNPHKVFGNNMPENVSNSLIIRIQPDEGMLLKLGMKIPGTGFKVETVNMDFHYSSLDNTRLPDAYERLLCDCMQGDATLYQRNDAVEATWSFVQPILDAWERDAKDSTNKIPLYTYKAFSWGPEAADELLTKQGHQWRYPCSNLENDGQMCML